MKKRLQLFVRQRKESLTAEEEQEMAAWQNEKDPDIEWNQLEQVWEQTGIYQETGFNPDTEGRWEQMQAYMRRHPQPSSRSFPWRRALGVAAVLLFLVSAGVITWWYRPGSAPSRLQTVLAVDGDELITLPEGTQVRLFAGSSLQFRQDLSQHSDREVFLHGSAYFAVTPVAGSTFRVHADEAWVEVLGTRFLVRYSPEQQRTEIEVEEGKVAFSGNTATDTVVLTQATRSVYRAGILAPRDSFQLETLQTPPRIWNARKATLSELQAQLRERMGERILFPPELADCTFTANLDLSSQYRLQKTLQALGYEVALHDDHTLVLSGTCP